MRKLLYVAMSAALLVGAGSTAALAGDPGGTAGPPGQTGPNQWTVEVSNHIVLSGSHRPGGGNVGGTVHYNPPRCWYEPVYTPAEAKAYYEGDIEGTESISPEWRERTRKDLQGPAGGQQYHEGDEGLWYSVRCLEEVEAPEMIAFEETNPRFVFVGPNDTAPAGLPVIDARMLAEIARAFLAVPTAPINSSPREGTPATVNLPTWLWADPGNRVQVTATIPGVLSSTVTADLQRIELTSVPAGATMHPGGGDCGNLGTKYVRGEEGAPPCGVTFGAPAGAPVNVGLNAVWHLSWTASNGQGDPNMDDATFAQTIPFTVQEVQVVGN